MDLLLRRRNMFKKIEYGPGEDGRIWAYYVVTDENRTNYQILNTYGAQRLSAMEVDGEPKPLATTYTFSEAGEHVIKFTMNGNLNNQFRNTNVRDVYFPKNITIDTGSSNNVLNGCSWLRTIRIPGTVNIIPKIYSNAAARSTDLADMEMYGVGGWTALTHNNIERIKVVGTFTSIPDSGILGFNDASNFKYIWIESPNLATIGSAFCRNMKKLVYVVINVDTPPTLSSSNLFGSTNSTFKIYVPYSSDHSILSSYQNTAPWSNYSSRIYELTADGEIPE